MINKNAVLALTKRKIIKGEMHYYILNALNGEERLMSKDELVEHIKEGRVANVKCNPVTKRLMGFPVPLSSYEVVGKEMLILQKAKLNISRKMHVGFDINDDNTTLMELEFSVTSEDALKRIMSEFRATNKVPKDCIKVSNNRIFIKGNLKNLKVLNSLFLINKSANLEVEADLYQNALDNCKRAIGDVKGEYFEQRKNVIDSITCIRVKAVCSFKEGEKVGTINGWDYVLLAGQGQQDMSITNLYKQDSNVTFHLLNSSKHRISDELSRFGIHADVKR